MEGPVTEPTAWEYDFVKVSLADYNPDHGKWGATPEIGPDIRMLDKVGAQGWEMCGLIPFKADKRGRAQPGGWAIVKRPLR